MLRILTKYMLHEPGPRMAFRKDTEMNETMSLPLDSIVYLSILGRGEWLFGQSILTFLSFTAECQVCSDLIPGVFRA